MELKKFTLKSVESSYARLIAFILEQAEGIENPKFHHELEIASEELIVNVIKYAYGDGEGDITVECGVDFESRRFRLTIRDKGMSFNPLTREDPDISVDFSQRNIGGMGIFMVRRLTDEQYYTRENGENILTIVKRF